MTLSAGQQLDQAVAEALGWSDCYPDPTDNDRLYGYCPESDGYEPVPFYSTDLTTAWDAFMAFWSRDRIAVFTKWPELYGPILWRNGATPEYEGMGEWRAGFGVDGDTEMMLRESNGSTPAEALCRSIVNREAEERELRENEAAMKAEGESCPS